MLSIARASSSRVMVTDGLEVLGDSDDVNMVRMTK